MNSEELQGDLLQSKPVPAAAPSAIEELQAQHRALQSLFLIALVALIFLSFGVNLYLTKQMTTMRARLYASRLEASQLSADFKRTSEPLVRNFVGNLQVFASTNRDLQPVLEKYRGALNYYFQPSLPASATSPAKPAPSGQ